MIDVLNWIAEHWCLTVTLSIIASGTYSVPKIICTMIISNATQGMR